MSEVPQPVDISPDNTPARESGAEDGAFKLTRTSPSLPERSEDRTPAQEAQLATHWRLLEPAIAEHNESIIRTLTRITGNPDTAKELAQEAWARGARALHQYEEEGIGIQAWITQIGRNLHRDQIRKRKARTVIVGHQVLEDQDEAMQKVEAPSHPERHPVDNVSWKLAVTALARRTPPEFFDAAWQCAVMGIPYKEHAAETGTNIGTVRSRVSRGRYAIGEAILAGPELMELLGTSPEDIATRKKAGKFDT